MRTVHNGVFRIVKMTSYFWGDPFPFLCVEHKSVYFLTTRPHTLLCVMDPPDGWINGGGGNGGGEPLLTPNSFLNGLLANGLPSKDGGGVDWAAMGLDDARVIVLGLAMSFVLLALLYYMVRCTAKALNWLVNLAFWAGIALLVVVVGMTALAVMGPWVVQTLGLSGLFGSVATPEPPEIFGASPVASDYVELEVDPLTGERVRLPRWSNAVERQAKASYWKTAQEGLEKLVGPDLASAVVESRTGSWAWVAVKYGTSWAGRASANAVGSVLSGGVEVVTTLFRSASSGDPESSPETTPTTTTTTTPTTPTTEGSPAEDSSDGQPWYRL